MKRILLGLAAALLASACGGTTTTPTPPPPPPVEDPPKITCPAAQTAQLTSGSTIAVPYTATATNGRAPVVITCSPPSGSPFGVGLATVTCTATDALQRTSQCAFAVTVLPQPKLAVARFFAFGDSITKGEDGSVLAPASQQFYPRVILPAPQTYPGALLTSLIARYTTQSPTVKNEGNPSEAVTGSGTFARFTALTSSGQYDAALIMEGSNDLYLARNSGGNPTTTMEQAAAGLRSMVRDAKNRGLRPFLATIPPMNPTGSRGQVFGWEYVSDFNDRIRSVAAAESVPLVDVYLAFGGNLGLLSADGVHPNAGGYQTIADTFFTAIKSTLEVTTTTSAVSSLRLR